MAALRPTSDLAMTLISTARPWKECFPKASVLLSPQLKRRKYYVCYWYKALIEFDSHLVSHVLLAEATLEPMMHMIILGTLVLVGSAFAVTTLLYDSLNCTTGNIVAICNNISVDACCVSSNEVRTSFSRIFHTRLTSFPSLCKTRHVFGARW